MGISGFDLAMLELFNAKERERNDWSRLFQEADPRFRFEGARAVAGADLSFICAVWQGDRD
jgi:hypothetical protein